MTATRRRYLWGLLGTLAVFLVSSGAATGEGMKQPLVRIAELEIDTAYIEPYTAALKKKLPRPSVLSRECSRFMQLQ